MTITPTFSTVCLSFSGGDSKLFCPILELVIFVDIYPVAVPAIALRCIVGHSVTYSPFGWEMDYFNA